MAKKKSPVPNVDLDITRLTRTLYFFIAVVAVSIVVFDSGNLITRDAVNDRWLLLTIILGANTAAWFFGTVEEFRKPVAYAMSALLIIYAGFMTYWERGMASTSTLLYIIPLLLIATLKNRHALIATSVFAAGTYAFAAVKYFNDYFNEGYRVQLWGNILQTGGTIFVCAWLIMILVGLRKDSR